MCNWKLWMRMLIAGIVLIVISSNAIPVMAGGPPVNWNKIDPALKAAMTANPSGVYPVIVEVGHPNNKTPTHGTQRASEALEFIKAAGGRAKNKLGIIGGATANITWDSIAKLSLNARVLRISLDRPVSASGTPASLYTQVVRAPEVWALGYTGNGIGIAIIDSGVYASNDLGSRLVARVDLVESNAIAWDPGGHGTHVAGIAAGNGSDSANDSYGTYKGIAPGAKVISIRVINSGGSATASAIIRGIQWAVQNRSTYNIRVLNLSLGGAALTSYKNDPLVTAAEVAWHAGIVVVSAAGNRGANARTIDTPGIDPFSITVGALDDQNTLTTTDDVVPWFSGRGPTPDNYAKPDLVAPGRRIVSLYSPNAYLMNYLSDRVTLTSLGKRYFRLTGTSQATPIVAGVAALLLQKNPALTPDQVKFVLKNTARALPGTIPVNTGGKGMVDAYAAVTSSAIGKENQGLRPTDSFCVNVYSMIKGNQPLTWKDPNYMNINWSNLTWDNLTWDNLTWDNLTWDNLTWDNLTWDNLTWDNLTWDSSGEWDSNGWDSAEDLD